MPKFESKHYTFYGYIILAILFGFCVGRMTNISVARENLRPNISYSNSPLIPVINIFGIENNKLIGVVQGDVRLFIADKMVTANNYGHISANASDLFTNYIPVSVPEGMNFVASKKGKLYYSVEKSAGQQIVPENRIYFRTAEEAQAAGYRAD